MKVLNSKLHNHLLKTETLSFGKLHFFENVMISEINNGVHIDVKKYLDLLTLFAEFYGTKKNVGYISNRVNNYSTSPVEISRIDLIKNVNISTNITYNSKDTNNAKFEQSFCKTELKNNFPDLYSGFNWVNEIVSNRLSLN